MKKSLIYCVTIFFAMAIIIFSCKKKNIPTSQFDTIPCIQLTQTTGTDTQFVTVNTAMVPTKYVLSGADSATINALKVSVEGTLPPGITTSFSNGVFTISGTPTTNIGSPFTYSILTGQTCHVTKTTGAIIVTNCGTVNLTSATATAAQSVVINTAITPITYSIGGAATGATISGLPAGVTGTYAAKVFTISGTPTSRTASPYTYTITTKGDSCSSTTTGTITVNVSPSTISGPLEVCFGTATTLIGSGTPATVSPWVSSTTSIATVNNAGVVTGTGAGTSLITYTNNVGATATAIVTVNPSPIITGDTIAIVGSTTSLLGSGTPGVTPWISSSPSSATINSSGIVTGVSFGTSLISYTNNNGCTTTETIKVYNVLPTFAVLDTICIGSAAPILQPTSTNGITGIWFPNTVSNTATTTYIFVPTPGQQAAPTSLQIVVLPNVTIGLSSGPAAQTVTVNAVITPITYTLSGGFSNVVVSGIPAGVTGSVIGNTLTIAGTPTATGTFNYTVNVTGSCSSPSAAGSITVNP